MLNFKEKTNHFLIGMGSAFNVWGNYYSPEYIRKYIGRHCRFDKRDTSVESIFKEVGKCFDWAINEYRK